MFLGKEIDFLKNKRREFPRTIYKRISTEEWLYPDNSNSWPLLYRGLNNSADYPLGLLLTDGWILSSLQNAPIDRRFILTKLLCNTSENFQLQSLSRKHTVPSVAQNNAKEIIDLLYSQLRTTYNADNSVSLISVISPDLSSLHGSTSFITEKRDNYKVTFLDFILHSKNPLLVDRAWDWLFNIHSGTIGSDYDAYYISHAIRSIWNKDPQRGKNFVVSEPINENIDQKNSISLTNAALLYGLSYFFKSNFGQVPQPHAVDLLAWLEVNNYKHIPIELIDTFNIPQILHPIQPRKGFGDKELQSIKKMREIIPEGSSRHVEMQSVISKFKDIPKIKVDKAVKILEINDLSCVPLWKSWALQGILESWEEKVRKGNNIYLTYKVDLSPNH